MEMPSIKNNQQHQQHQQQTQEKKKTEMLPIHQNIYNRLNAFFKSNNVPNILFYGPTGCGKSTVINQFIRQIYHENTARIKKFTLHIDCTHFKGIKFIRDELKFFAQSNFTDDDTFKIIILQNADKLTIDAQSALRRCIEIFIRSTRFFIDVTDKEGLIKPILSRFCSIYIPIPEMQFQSQGQGQNVPVNLYKYKMEQWDEHNKLSRNNTNRYENIRKKVQKIIKNMYRTQCSNEDTQTQTQTPNDETKLNECENEEKISKAKVKENDTNSTATIFSTAETLYQSGISCLDLLKIIEHGNLVQNDVAFQHDILFTFGQWQKQIRNEKILMATLLKCIITHSNIIVPFEVA